MPNKRSSLNTTITKASCTTEAKEINICFEWTIKKFNLIYKKMGEEYTSTTFFSDDYDPLKWYLKIKPNGYNEDSKDYVSLFLYMKAGDSFDFDVSFKLALRNDKGKETNAFKANSLFKTNDSAFGWPKFVDRNFLLDTSNGLLPENKLTILCEISYISDITNVNAHSSSVPIKMLDSKLADDLVKLFDNSKFCDVTLVASGQEFKAHKTILAARSDVFAAMFEHNLEENITNRVVINDIDHEVLKEMLHFIYTDKATNLNEMAKDLLVAADKYALEKLKGLCEEALCHNLSIDTAVETLMLAERYGAHQLKARTKAFIHAHVNDVMDTQSWKEATNKSS